MEWESVFRYLIYGAIAYYGYLKMRGNKNET